MSQEVYGLRYDFIYRHGNFMSLFREEGLPAEQLSLLQLKMIESNTIPRLLPLEIQEIDFRVSLLYNITSKRMLSHVLKSEGLTKLQMCQLLYSVSCAISDCRNYMLNETQFILRDNFIFIGSDISDVYVTYLPFQKMKDEIPLFQQFAMLAGQLASKIREEERQEADAVRLLCNEHFQVADFKLKLLEMMGVSERKQGEEAARIQLGAVLPPPPMSELHSAAPLLVLHSTNKSEDRQKSLFATGMPGKFLSEKSKAMAALTAFFNWFKGKKAGSGDMEQELFPPLNGQAEEMRIDANEFYKSLGTRTTLLSPMMSNATVYLGAPPADHISSDRPKQPILEISTNGSTTRVPLQEASFVIGRGEKETDYLDETFGVSRLHAEIFKSEGGFNLKDLGSKNGTLLNGETLVPYRDYKLHDGDTFRIVLTDYTFRWE